MTNEEKLKILSVQTPATQRLLRFQWDMETEEDKAFRYGNPVAVPDAKTWEERVGARGFTFHELQTEMKLRQSRGQYIAEMHGDVEPMPINEEKRERAINAFMFVKKVFTDLMKQWGIKDSKPETTIERVRREAKIEE